MGYFGVFIPTDLENFRVFLVEGGGAGKWGNEIAVIQKSYKCLGKAQSCKHAMWYYAIDGCYYFGSASPANTESIE